MVFFYHLQESTDRAHFFRILLFSTTFRVFITLYTFFRSSSFAQLPKLTQLINLHRLRFSFPNSFSCPFRSILPFYSSQILFIQCQLILLPNDFSSFSIRFHLFTFSFFTFGRFVPPYLQVFCCHSNELC